MTTQAKSKLGRQQVMLEQERQQQAAAAAYADPAYCR